MGAFHGSNSNVLVEFVFKIVLIYNIIILNSPMISSLKEVSYFDDPITKNYESVDIDPPKLGWVDPFDMLKDMPLSDNLIVQSDVDNYVLANRLKKYESYARRFVNLFLRAIPANPKDEAALIDSDKYMKLEIFISGKNLLLLRDFGENGESNGAKLETVSEIFEQIFRKNSGQEQHHYSLGSFFRWIQRSFEKLLKSPEWTVVSSVLLLIVVTLWFARTHSYCLAFFFLFLTVFVCGFGFTWIRMYEEKEVEKYVNHVIHGDIPPHCTGTPLPLHTHMYYRMFGVDCLEFYKIRDVRSFVKISPTDVFSETISAMFVNPATNIGKAYGNFVYSFTGSVPLWLTPFAVVLGFILPPVFGLVLLCFLFGYGISTGLTGVSLRPSFPGGKLLESRRSACYIEDVSKESSENRKKNNDNKTLLTENQNPLFIAMNWKGLQQLMSGSNKVDENDSGNTQEAKSVGSAEDIQKSDEQNIQTIAESGEPEDTKALTEIKGPTYNRKKSKSTSKEHDHTIESSQTENEEENLSLTSSSKCTVSIDKTATFKEKLT